MTDKVADREVAGASDAVAGLESNATAEPAYLIPESADIEVLKKNFGASR